MKDWLRKTRSERLNEPIDEEDLEKMDPDTFCGTGYVFITTYEGIRRNPEPWVNHSWSYVVMDEAQKIRNPDADVTLACKVGDEEDCCLGSHWGSKKNYAYLQIRGCGHRTV